ncbi:hypothetical protein ACLRGI_15775 [Paenarthrobacter nitroguajacolicus]|uniref:hypothetical protein n=1 Tax=Paenarthrobacter nitroguajacolicus TaxID=211146 RepID=UPI003AE1ACE7
MKRIASKLSALSVLFLCATWFFLATGLKANPPKEGSERGDVPGWVMITLMSAILVAGLLAIATPALGDLFEQAMSKVGQ